MGHETNINIYHYVLHMESDSFLRNHAVSFLCCHQSVVPYKSVSHTHQCYLKIHSTNIHYIFISIYIYIFITTSWIILTGIYKGKQYSFALIPMFYFQSACRVAEFRVGTVTHNNLQHWSHVGKLNVTCRQRVKSGYDIQKRAGITGR